MGTQMTHSVNDNEDKKEDDDIGDLISDFGRLKLQKSVLFYAEDCLKHRPPDNESHVECPERCSKSFQMLTDYGIINKLNVIKPREATLKELALTHHQSHIKTVTNPSEECGWYDADTFYNQHSKHAALLAAAASIDLVDGILSNKYDNGFALVRPPGHHCEHNKAMGFCLFNNVVVAVNAVLEKDLCQKVLIVDWDVHHGNGTQNMFYDKKNVLYFSVHRHDGGRFYPNTGKILESGNGFNVNVPLNVHRGHGYGDEEYLLIWRDILLPICGEFVPDVIVVSAGFDACIGDPLGGMRITPPCYGLLTRLLLNECSNVAIVLEGGYNLSTMPRAICCVNYALLTGPKQQKHNYNVFEFEKEFLSAIDGKEKQQTFNEWKSVYKKHLNDNDSSIKNGCQETIKKALNEHSKYWKCIENVLSKY